MKIYARLLLSFVAAMTAISACNVEGSQKDLLIRESWKLLASETVDYFDTIDNYTRLKACEKDNLYHFKPDQNLEIDEGPIKCNPSDPQIYIDGTWTLSNLETHITINDIEYLIIQFTESRFKIKADIQVNGRFVTTELTFGR